MRFKNGGREIDMKTIRIDDASQILESDVTHENLKIMYGTGISMYNR